MSFNVSWPALGRITVTLVALAAAGAVGWRLWQHYEVEPWTRDGRIRANVVQVAPDVTGQVTAVFVHDNQRVDAGQPLFEIDRARFELALRQAESVAQAQKVALDQAAREAKRNTELHELVAQEAREQGQSHLEQARAALAQAEVNRDLARLNLARTRVLSAVNGVVTNLDLQAGTYVTAGHPVMALIDHDSFYAEGYFEETKLAAIHVGDPVSVSLMGEQQLLSGHVDSFAGGIADRDRSTASNLLPNVNPTFNWVRLAQRIPVRVALDKVPEAIRLVAGQTVTVDVHGRTAAAVKAQ
jgi:RND family efflux transporter MFP subunit